jgi:hypothetical protein
VSPPISLLHKLWNRGVDIGVGVITSLIVAIIGLLFWRAKLWLDLRADKAKRDQQHRMEDERAAQQRRREAFERYASLKAERDNLANAAASAETRFALAELWERYFKWLHDKDLAHLPRNLHTLSHYAGWSQSLRGVGSFPPEQLSQDKNTMTELIRSTDLPELEE